MTIALYQRTLARRVNLLLIDLFLISISTVLALVLRDNFETDRAHLLSLLPYLLVTLGVSIPVLILSGLDRSVWRFSALSDYLRVFGAVVAIVAGAVVVAFIVNRMDGLARALPVMQAILMTFLLVGARVLMRLRHAGRGTPAPVASMPMNSQETVLVVGLNAIAELFIRSVDEFAADRIRIAGLIGRSEQQRGRLLQRYEVLGVPEELTSIIDNLSVHGVAVVRIIVAVPLANLSPEAQESLFALSRASNIRLDFFAERILSPEAGAGGPGRGAQRADQPPVTFVVDEQAMLGSDKRLFWASKRVLDVIGSATLLVLLAPMFVLLALCVLADVGFPAMFWQQRPGRAGRPFRLHKFRTMADAHDARGSRVPDAQRLSAFGRFLRRTRLDELPQLINILLGDMSFVGPRPLLAVDQSGNVARLLVRPGLTGWAQVMGGRIVNPTDKAALDVWYVCNASFRLDMTILAYTVPMILFGERINAKAVEQAWDDLSKAGVCGRAVMDDAHAGSDATLKLSVSTQF